MTTVHDVGRFYTHHDGIGASHLALSWKGRVRYTVPRDRAAQKACWEIFRPGPLGLAFRSMARLPRIFGSANCVEGVQIERIRQEIGTEAGQSCCRAGAAGPWSKDTIVLLDSHQPIPLYFAKAGVGDDVNMLLENEAKWLRRLGDQPDFAGHVPRLLAHHAGKDLCFVVQQALSGETDFNLGAAQLNFLRKLQGASLKEMRFEESVLYRTLCSRTSDLEGLLPAPWSIRIEGAISRICKSLSNSHVPAVIAHNDFTPWNIRVIGDRCAVFDWEYAAEEQLPLFDPLHFALLPMALKQRPAEKMKQRMLEIVQLGQKWFGLKMCEQAHTQALAYLINVCTLYLWSFRGNYKPDPIVESYGRLIDLL